MLERLRRRPPAQPAPEASRPPSRFPSLAIDCEGMALPVGAKVSLDGHDITYGLRSLTLRMGADSINEVELTVAVEHVEITTDALLALTVLTEETDRG